MRISKSLVRRRQMSEPTPKIVARRHSRPLVRAPQSPPRKTAESGRIRDAETTAKLEEQKRQRAKLCKLRSSSGEQGCSDVCHAKRHHSTVRVALEKSPETYREQRAERNDEGEKLCSEVTVRCGQFGPLRPLVTVRWTAMQTTRSGKTYSRTGHWRRPRTPRSTSRWPRSRERSGHWVTGQERPYRGGLYARALFQSSRSPRES